MDNSPRSKELNQIIDHLKDYPEEQRFIRSLLNDRYMSINTPAMPLVYISVSLDPDTDFLGSAQITSECQDLCEILGVNESDVLGIVSAHSRKLSREIHDILLIDSHSSEVN